VFQYAVRYLWSVCTGLATAAGGGGDAAAASHIATSSTLTSISISTSTNTGIAGGVGGGVVVLNGRMWDGLTLAVGTGLCFVYNNVFNVWKLEGEDPRFIKLGEIAFARCCV
jgi:hypothetical protein